MRRPSASAMMDPVQGTPDPGPRSSNPEALLTAGSPSIGEIIAQVSMRRGGEEGEKEATAVGLVGCHSGPLPPLIGERRRWLGRWRGGERSGGGDGIAPESPYTNDGGR